MQNIFHPFQHFLLEYVSTDLKTFHFPKCCNRSKICPCLRSVATIILDPSKKNVVTDLKQGSLLDFRSVATFSIGKHSNGSKKIVATDLKQG